MRPDLSVELMPSLILSGSKNTKAQYIHSRHEKPTYRDPEQTFESAQRQTDQLDNLRSDFETLGVAMSEDDYSRCISHLELVHKWNQSINLTSVRKYDELVSRHLLDSLSIVQFITAVPHAIRQRIVDLGSGAGFPGIPIALAMPDSHVSVVDASAKKAQFLTHVVAQLKLTNIEVVNQRIQQIPISRFDTVVARALGSLRAVVELASPLINDCGRILVMKGRYPQQELRDLSQQYDYTVKKVFVPRLNAERHLVIIRQSLKNATVR